MYLISANTGDPALEKDADAGNSGQNAQETSIPLVQDEGVGVGLEYYTVRKNSWIQNN